MTDDDAKVGVSFEERVSSLEMRFAYQIAYSIRMLGEIGARYRTAQDSDDVVPALVMLDSFYVHLRLLAEFLTVQPAIETLDRRIWTPLIGPRLPRRQGSELGIGTAARPGDSG